MSEVKNVVLVLLDSTNKHHLSSYGGEGVSTPNLDRFAERAFVFDNHFVGSLPCMPARREIFTGRKEFLWRPWGSLEPFDKRLPEILVNEGMLTGIVTDHFHYWEEAANGYIQGFQSTELIRGHEIDPWKPLLSTSHQYPQWVQNIEKWRPGQGRRYYSNVMNFADETEFFPAKVFTAACNWLDERPEDQPFFLQVESFDIHEPFHVPEPYASMYGPNRLDDEDPHFNVWPPYQNPASQSDYMAGASPEALQFVRNQYDGKLTMVDTWLGKLLDKLEADDLFDSTMVIVTTDHGHDLGERGVFGKSYPHFDSHANIPLMVWHPAYPGNGQRVRGLTSTVDLFATTLDAVNIADTELNHSVSLLPLMEDPNSTVRDELLYGTFGQGVCYTDGKWTLMKSPPEANDPELYAYSALNSRPLMSQVMLKPEESGDFIPGVPVPQWKTVLPLRPLSHENYLFDREADVAQQNNLWNDESDVKTSIIERLTNLIEQESAPIEQFKRLGLR